MNTERKRLYSFFCGAASLNICEVSDADIDLIHDRDKAPAGAALEVSTTGGNVEIVLSYEQVELLIRGLRESHGRAFARMMSREYTHDLEQIDTGDIRATFRTLSRLATEG